MIGSFKCKYTQKLYNGGFIKKFSGFQGPAEEKLFMLDAAYIIDDLRSPPGNRLELLKGNRQDQYSIRINKQWRICFIWENGKAYNVEIVDYH